MLTLSYPVEFTILLNTFTCRYKVKIDEFELNLRRNRIMGGVIYFDMLYIPPQPKKVKEISVFVVLAGFVIFSGGELGDLRAGAPAGVAEPAMGGGLQATRPGGRELKREEDAGGDRAGDQGPGGGAAETAAGNPKRVIFSSFLAFHSSLL